MRDLLQHRQFPAPAPVLVGCSETVPGHQPRLDAEEAPRRVHHREVNGGRTVIHHQSFVDAANAKRSSGLRRWITNGPTVSPADRPKAESRWRPDEQPEHIALPSHDPMVGANQRTRNNAEVLAAGLRMVICRGVRAWFLRRFRIIVTCNARGARSALAPAEPVAYAVAYAGPQRCSGAVFCVAMVRSEAETSLAAGFKTTAFVHSATPPRLILRTSRAGVPPVATAPEAPLPLIYP